MNLQHHVIREKKLAEKETLVIFYNVIQVCCGSANVLLNLEMGGLIDWTKILKLYIR